MRVVVGSVGSALLLAALASSPRPALAQEEPSARSAKAGVATEKAKVADAKGVSESKLSGDLERQALKREIAKFGMVAIVQAAFADAKPTSASPWGPDPRRATHATKASADMWTATIDDAFGPGGLKLSSPGDEADEGDRGPTPIVSLRRIATIGGGDGVADVAGFDGGRGHVSGTHVPHGPAMRAPSLARSRIPPETIQRVVRQSFGRFRVCYESALRVNPGLEGRIAVKFTIDPSGAVSVASDGGSDLPDARVVSCIVRGFATLTFPEFDSGVVTVVYPLAFTPGPGPGPVR